MKFNFGGSRRFAQGTTILRDAAELRVKESDRIAVMATQPNQMGSKVKQLNYPMG